MRKISILFPEFRIFISLILCKSIIHQIGFSCNKKKPEKNCRRISPATLGSDQNPPLAGRRYSAAAEVKNMAAKGLFALNEFFT
jgi:hypothetical protein